MMDLLLCRKRETDILRRIYSSKEAEFLALYGRRRVGKTYLIKQFFASYKDLIFFEVTGAKNAPMIEQISHFCKSLGETFYSGAPLAVPKNWDNVFAMLKKIIDKQSQKQKIVLFFDEFPWMVTRNSRLLETLDYYWNRYWSFDPRIKLIICGSSASWIIKNIVNNKGGLHNRLTQRIRLEPFTLSESKLFLVNKGVKLNNQQILQVYMMMGGVPYYLKQIEKGESAAQAIERLAFNSDGILLNEFNNLFSALFHESEIHMEILRILVKHKNGVGKTTLLESLNNSYIGSHGVDKLNELEEAGFIKSFKPHFHKRQGVYYKLIDEYVLFYLTWIEPIKDTLQVSSLEHGNWVEAKNTSKWNTWLGYAFEAICYKHLSLIKKALNLTAGAIANTWRYIPKKGSTEDGAEIDLLFDRNDNCITLCEIKYSEEPYSIDKRYASILKRKTAVFNKQTRNKKQLFWAIISVAGLKPTIYSEDMITGSVDLNDFFE